MSKNISTNLPPFGKDFELYTKLHLDSTLHRLTRNSSKGQAAQQKPAALPNHPHILLDDPLLLEEHLVNEFRTEYLDRFSPHLWLVATQSHSHISSLTHQLVRRRNIIISEDPRLHLLWYHDCIYLKPLPPYLLSHAFWAGLPPASPLADPLARAQRHPPRRPRLPAQLVLSDNAQVRLRTRRDPASAAPDAGPHIRGADAAARAGPRQRLCRRRVAPLCLRRAARLAHQFLESGHAQALLLPQERRAVQRVFLAVLRDHLVSVCVLQHGVECDAGCACGPGDGECVSRAVWRGLGGCCCRFGVVFGRGADVCCESFAVFRDEMGVYGWEP